MAEALSVVIVNWNTCEMLRVCLGHLYSALAAYDLDVTVVDNGSTDGSLTMLAADFPAARRLALGWNSGFAFANNRGVAATRHDVILLLNSDAWADPAAAERDFARPLLAVLAAQPRAAIVGPQLRNADRSFQASYTPFPTLWREWLNISGLGRRLYGDSYPSRGPEEARGPQPIDTVEGACMLVRRAAFEAVGGFDERFWMYSEDVDLCLRLRRAGWEIWYQPQSVLLHVHAGSSRRSMTTQLVQMYHSRVRYFLHHHGRAQAHLLKWLIVLVSAVKIAVFGALRRLTGREVGHRQAALRDLLRRLSEVV